MDAINDRSAMPVLDAQQVTTLISDSGVTRFRITASEWQVYDKAKPSYWEFPKGIYLEQFDAMLNTSATLRADYAYYDDQQEIWHLTGNVNATNVNGEQFETPELYWEQKTERVYSDSSITIIQPPTQAAIKADGDNAKYLESLGYDVTASDVATDFLATLEARDLHPVKFNVLTDEFPGQYHGIFCWRVFVHFTPDDVLVALKKTYAALEPGGRFVFNMINREVKDVDREWVDFPGVYEMGVDRYFNYFREADGNSKIPRAGGGYFITKI